MRQLTTKLKSSVSNLGKVCVAFQPTGLKHSGNAPSMCKAQQMLWMPALISCFITEEFLHFVLFMKFPSILLDGFLTTKSSEELVKMFWLNKLQNK